MRKRFDSERLYHRFRSLPEMCDEGLVFGRGTVLARCALAPDDRSISDADGERIAALLAIVGGHRSGSTVRKFVARSAARWRAGDAALAQIELAFAQLPRLASDADAYRLFLAEAVLADGMALKELVRALGFDQDLLKYDSSQPRVPAGSGRASGQWSGGDAVVEGRSVSRDDSRTPQSGPRIRPERDAVRIATDDHSPVHPGGQFRIPRPVPDPLDPKGLNEGLTPMEEQAIARTLSTIRSSGPVDLRFLQPHPFRNFPHDETGAIMPPSLVGYKSYGLDDGQKDRGETRILIDQGSKNVYYTNNHYKSYYHIGVGDLP